MAQLEHTVDCTKPYRLFVAEDLKLAGMMRVELTVPVHHFWGMPEAFKGML